MSLRKKNHQAFSSEFSLKPELRKNKLVALNSVLRSQRTLLSPFIKEADPATKASRVTSWNTNHAKRPYANEAFVTKKYYRSYCQKRSTHNFKIVPDSQVSSLISRALSSELKKKTTSNSNWFK
jgi:hypothetical protein